MNLAALHDFLRKDLLECIERAPDGRLTKALVIDKALIGLLGLVTKHSDLKARCDRPEEKQKKQKKKRRRKKKKKKKKKKAEREREKRRRERRERRR